MAKKKKEEAVRCQAMATRDGRITHFYRCTKGARCQVEGYHLCGIHRRAYLNGTMIRIVEEVPSRYPLSSGNLKRIAELNYVPPDSGPRYAVEYTRGEPRIVERTPGWDLKTWREMNPDWKAVVKEYKEALAKYIDGLEEEVAALKKRLKAAKKGRVKINTY